MTKCLTTAKSESESMVHSAKIGAFVVKSVIHPTLLFDLISHVVNRKEDILILYNPFYDHLACFRRKLKRIFY